MTEAVNQDVRMFERAMRVEAHHVEGADPTLCYVAIYVTDERGQWAMYDDWTFEPFEQGAQVDECKSQIKRLLSHLLR